MIRQYLFRINIFLSRQKAATITLIAILLSVFLGVLDYLTGFEISFSFFYLLPISLATWFVGIRSGYLISVICISIWTIINWLAGESFSVEIIRFWNAFIRLMVFIAFSYLLHGLKSALDHERTLSRTDFVTGIMNTREFHRMADLEILRSHRYNHALAVAYIDLDNFKRVNDELGHSVGDDLLRTVATTIAENLRRTDIVARIGGDEFAILLPEVDSSNARQAVEKIKKRLAEKLARNYPYVTMSIGVICFTPSIYPLDQLLKQADTLMYEAKSRGKDQIIYKDIE